MPPMASMIYGTAWKGAETGRLVYEAIKAGFRSIDTAAMARHYNEAGCGDGIRRAVHEGLVSRSDLYIQTKFSPHDDAFADTTRYPDISSQVDASVAQSLSRLQASDNPRDRYLDCLVLHSPYPRHEDTLVAWRALSAHVPEFIRSLGISNITHHELQGLLDSPNVNPPPAVVQNRFAASEHGWDAATRSLCASSKIAYQGFWTLTANQREWQTSDYVGAVAAGAGVSRAVAWYSLMIGMDIVVLNGTTNVDHMREDLAGLGRIVEWRATEEGEKVFEQCLAAMGSRTGTVHGS
ncbi:Aldo/keto reductase [Coniochaeta ligniaria NRRL 30616]|uniref:Aldo/keto reductase n=1 Tax=Coniochaeta ligniaria NRRL 30616 TaxID=1408157 RepID=A0A1J7J758_9PEZI|nr:Aldo/keto reductase [Coniochaeta ligniaria NRRL 30616]